MKKSKWKVVPRKSKLKKFNDWILKNCREIYIFFAGADFFGIVESIFINRWIELLLFAIHFIFMIFLIILINCMKNKEEENENND